nr:UL37 [Human alphaherpesvirus 2]
MDWLLINELLQVTDGVFRASAFRPSAGPGAPGDLEAQDAGGSTPEPTTPGPQDTQARAPSTRPAGRETVPWPNTPVEDDEMTPQETPPVHP